MLSSSLRIIARNSPKACTSPRQFPYDLRRFSFTSKLLQAEVLDNDVASGGLAPVRSIRNIAIIAHGG
jgi:hypothetical protein